MNESIEYRYAKLLVDYCLQIKPGDQCYIRTTWLAEPLVKELYRLVLQRGGVMEVDFRFADQLRIFTQEAHDPFQLNYISASYEEAIRNFDAYLYIKAPYNTAEDQGLDADKMKIRRQATLPIQNIYSERTASGELRRSLCEYPTQAAAQQAGMSLEAYQDFVYNACRLTESDPIQAWTQVGKEQQSMVDYLNQIDQMEFRNEHSRIRFSTKDRHWINSDGRTNMPSGEVFTGPIEDSVQGHILFDYPSVILGEEVRDIYLEVDRGKVVKWQSSMGQKALDRLFDIEGSRYFGEVAIGTNYKIQKGIKNILFDEKIGGTIHMAVGQSYKQTGGKNESSVHVDMIAGMQSGGIILADGIEIYRDGHFTIF